jgi:hypothetical protein
MKLVKIETSLRNSYSQRQYQESLQKGTIRRKERILRQSFGLAIA